MSEQNPYQAPVLAPALANDRGLELLERISREMKTIRELVSKVVNYMVDAESEIPEKMRRFIMYMHDVHD
ncbi:MAG: hypothetical protein ACREHG_05520, partial [Candidatus Saccharimonadales bacterium]